MPNSQSFYVLEDASAEAGPVVSAGAQVQQSWFNATCFLLAGYALAGKGFAYLGIPPLFVGEVVLLIGCMVFLAFGYWRYLVRVPIVWSIVGLFLWGGFTTLPHIGTYGVDSLRDAMLWGYAAFALLMGGILLVEPCRLGQLIERYHLFVYVYILIIPFTYAVSLLELAPVYPWAMVAVIDVKVGDVLAHAAGVFAFWASGLRRPAHALWLAPLLAYVAVAGAASRGGLMAFIAAVGICLFFRPYSRIIWSVAFGAICAFLILAVSDLRVEVPGKDREFSAQQVIDSLFSVVENSGNSELDSTKRWRLNWWTDIVNYTVHGEYFWMGKGFGINLADSDGYQGTQWEGLLRSPHNAHLTMLARAGVPGLLLWVLPQIAWLGISIRCIIRSYSHGQSQWNSLFVFLLAYWSALLIRASFDVFLEGPVGGIWFWCIYGVGIGAAVIYNYSPDTLKD
jgi:hypothetical protein